MATSSSTSGIRNHVCPAHGPADYSRTFEEGRMDPASRTRLVRPRRLSLVNAVDHLPDTPSSRSIRCVMLEERCLGGWGSPQWRRRFSSSLRSGKGEPLPLDICSEKEATPASCIVGPDAASANCQIWLATSIAEVP